MKFAEVYPRSDAIPLWVARESREVQTRLTRKKGPTREVQLPSSFHGGRMTVDSERGSLLLNGTLSGSLEASLYRNLEEAYAKIGRLTEEVTFLRARIRTLEAKQ